VTNWVGAPLLLMQMASKSGSFIKTCLKSLKCLTSAVRAFKMERYEI
jgi:hypothetical protein